jgi:hypothetical protein
VYLFALQHDVMHSTKSGFGGKRLWRRMNFRFAGPALQSESSYVTKELRKFVIAGRSADDNGRVKPPFECPFSSPRARGGGAHRALLAAVDVNAAPA